VDFTCNTAKMFSFGPNPTREKKAWSSSTCLLYGLTDKRMNVYKYSVLLSRFPDATCETYAHFRHYLLTPE
jgi:hypothetical protein